jgi:hypothetical protein
VSDPQPIGPITGVLLLTTCQTVEFATVGQTEDGKIYHRLWSADEITALLKEHDLAKDESAEDK